MITDFQKSLLVNIAQTITDIRATIRAILDLEAQVQEFVATILIVASSPPTDEEEVESREFFLAAATLAIRNALSSLQALRETLQAKRALLAAEVDFLASTL